MPNLSDINWLSPVNIGHSLNRGSVGWWLGLPNIQGQVWRDLMGKNPGTLTKMNTNVSGWRNTTRPGGYSHLVFDGIDDWVEATAGGSYTTNWAIACSLYLSSTSANGMCIKVGGNQNIDGVGLGVGSADADTAGNNLLVLYEAVRWMTVATAVGTGWFRLLLSMNESGFPTAYVNGVQTYSDTTGAPSASTNRVRIGGYDAGVATRFFAGPIDNCRLWNRALSATEARQEYDLSCIGYPGVLNYSLSMMRLAAAMRMNTLAAGMGGNPDGAPGFTQMAQILAQ